MKASGRWFCAVAAVVVGLALWLGIGPDVAAPSVSSAQATVPTATPVATVAPAWQSEAANALEAQVIAVYEEAAPAVVNITSRRIVTDFFLRAIPQEGSGSGFLWDNAGHVVTNYHVVENAQGILVTFADGRTYEAEVAGVDATNDLAVLRVEAEAGLPRPLTLADASQLRVGQFVLAIGNPYGLDHTLTVGVISALERVIQSPEEAGFIGEAIQTDAAVNPGNSGGPLLDLRGRVVGVNSQIISPSGASAGIGFAVSSSTVARVVPALIEQGYYDHPWLGIETVDLTSSAIRILREAGMDVPVDAGLMVVSVVRGSPAERAGIRGAQRQVTLGRYRIPVDGDIITAVNGVPVRNQEELTVYLETKTVVGDIVELTVIRNGVERQIAVPVAASPQ